MAEPISALFSSLAAAGSSALPAATAPSILGGGMTGAGMMTAGAPIVPGLLASSTPTLMGGLGSLGGSAMEAAGATSALNPAVPTTFMNQNISPLLTNEANRAAASFNPSQYATQGFTDGVMNQYAPNFADIVGGKSADFTGGGYGGSFLDDLSGAGLDYAKKNPALALGIYDRISEKPQPKQVPQLSVIRPQQSGQYQSPMQARIPQSTYPRRLY
jgi:hypothetical protein